MKFTNYITTTVINYFSRSYLASLIMCAVMLSQFPVETHARDIKTEAADIIFRNGAVYTVDKANSCAEAIAVKHGAIVYMGDSQSAESYKGQTTKVVNLNGRMLLPSVNDPHMHTLSGKPTFESKFVGGGNRGIYC